MVVVAKWLTHRIVAPAFGGSNPLIHPNIDIYSAEVFPRFLCVYFSCILSFYGSLSNGVGDAISNNIFAFCYKTMQAPLTNFP